MCVFSVKIMNNIMWIVALQRQPYAHIISVLYKADSVTWLKACLFLQCFSVMFALIFPHSCCKQFNETHAAVWSDGTFSENQSSLWISHTPDINAVHVNSQSCCFPKSFLRRSSTTKRLWLILQTFFQSFPPQFCP